MLRCFRRMDSQGLSRRTRGASASEGANEVVSGSEGRREADRLRYCLQSAEVRRIRALERAWTPEKAALVSAFKRREEAKAEHRRERKRARREERTGGRGGKGGREKGGRWEGGNSRRLGEVRGAPTPPIRALGLSAGVRVTPGLLNVSARSFGGGGTPGPPRDSFRGGWGRMRVKGCSSFWPPV